MVMGFFTLSGQPQSKISDAWHSRNNKEVSRILERIDEGDKSGFDNVSDLTEILKQTSSSKMRAAVAMALVKIDAKDAKDSILDVLRRPEIANVSGTLIYALNELGFSMPIDIAIAIIKNGSFEGRAETLTLFEENRVDVHNYDKSNTYKNELEELSKSEDAEVSEAAQLAISYIEDNMEPEQGYTM